MKIPSEFYTRDDTLQIARDLLGKTLVIPNKSGERISGKIVEIEAYLGPEDKAAHSRSNRRTNRNEVMYSAGGVAYVFFVYGMYYQFNVVAGESEVPHAILIRALEPLEGIDAMRKRRGKMPDINLTSGPGKLCIAFGIDKGLNGESLSGERVWLEEERVVSDDLVESGNRVGIDYAEEYIDKPWRFWIKDNDYVSR